MKRPIENCYWVAPGKLLAGEYPRDLDDESSAAKVAALKRAGVGLFVDLTEEDELLPYAQWAAPARHERFPIRDVSIPRSHAQTAATLDAIDAHVEAGGTVYVHCWGGVGRTGVIVGCWLARRRGSGREGLAGLRTLWRTCPKSRIQLRSPQTMEQEKYILRWREDAATREGRR